MVTVLQSETFRTWLGGLRDRAARTRILARITRLEVTGNAGDVKAVGDGVSEMRIDCGPGYRVYFVQRGSEIVILLCGGDKSTQSADIERAKAIASQL